MILITLAECAFLFVFSYRESYKEAHIPQSRSFMILAVALPAVLYFLISAIFYGNVYIAMLPMVFAEHIARGAENIRFGTFFCCTVILNVFFAIALYLGGYFGKRKRGKDKNKLTSQQEEN